MADLSKPPPNNEVDSVLETACQVLYTAIDQMAASAVKKGSVEPIEVVTLATLVQAYTQAGVFEQSIRTNDLLEELLYLEKSRIPGTIH